MIKKVSMICGVVLACMPGVSCLRKPTDYVADNEKATQEKLAKRQTPDLTLFDLHGPVKSVQLNENFTSGDVFSMKAGFFMDGHSFTFSPEGDWRLKTATIGDMTYNICRDRQGYITSLECKSKEEYTDSNPTIQIKWKDGHVSEIKDQPAFWYYDTKFTYTGSRIVEVKCLMDEGDSGVCVSEGVIRYLKSDSYDNWTLREIEVKGYCQEGDVIDRFSGTLTQQRVINYY